MKYSGVIHLATIHQVELKIHFTLGLFLIYIMISAYHQFYFIAGRAGIRMIELTWSPFSWALISVVGLLFSLLTHELGHLALMWLFGSKLHGMTLILAGGISTRSKHSGDPYQDFKVSILGPGVSFLLCGLFFLIQSKSDSANLKLLCYGLGWANLALGFVNLLPVFPFDGGRALQSLLAVKNGKVRSTQLLVKISRFFSWTIGIWGFLQLNILWILAAFFVNQASRAELYSYLSKGAIEGLKVRDLMTRVPAVDEATLVKDAAALMLRSRRTILPVRTSSGHPALIALEHLREISRNLWSTTPVSQCMENVPHAVNIHDSIGSALPTLLMTSAQALPVEENKQLVGVIRYCDLDEILRPKGSLSTDHPELRNSLLSSKSKKMIS